MSNFISKGLAAIALIGALVLPGLASSRDWDEHFGDNRHKIDHVAGFATARCCHHLVHGKVNRMQKPGRFFYEV